MGGPGKLFLSLRAAVMSVVGTVGLGGTLGTNEAEADLRFGPKCEVLILTITPILSTRKYWPGWQG